MSFDFRGAKRVVSGRAVATVTCAIATACAAACATPKTDVTPAGAAVREEVAATLAHGARTWNAGDLDGFISDYWPDSTTTYIGRRGVVRGPEAIKAVYAPRFALGAARDSLHFENLEVDVLGPNVVNAIAWYVLMRGDSITSRGPTSLVMRKADGRWRIVHDHSS